MGTQRLPLIAALCVAFAACAGSSPDDVLDGGQRLPALVTPDVGSVAPAEQPPIVPSTTAPPATTTSTTSTSPPTTVAPTTAPQSTITPATAPLTTAPLPTAPPQTAPASTSTLAPVADHGETCVDGTWIIAGSQLDALYGAIASNARADTDLSADGTINLAMYAGTFQYSADVDLTVGLDGAVGVGTVDGRVDGTYDVVDDTLAVQTTSGSLQVVLTVDGAPVDPSDLGNPMLVSLPLAGAPIECAGGIPTLSLRVGADGQRQSVTLIAL